MSKVVPCSAVSQAHKINFSDHVTPWLTFRATEQRKLFEEFKSSQSNTYAFLAVQLVVSTFIGINKWYSWILFPTQLSLTSLVIGAIFPCILGFILLLIRILPDKHKVICSSKEYFAVMLKSLESFWVLGSCFTYNMSIIVLVANGQCDGDDFLTTQGCNLNASQMPLDMMMVSIIIPAMFSMILKGATWEFVCFTFVADVALLIFTMCYYDLLSSIPSLILFVPFCMVVMYENQRQNISVFLLTQNQQNLLVENERLADETHANELRHMIGNVAHDLKTVFLSLI